MRYLLVPVVIALGILIAGCGGGGSGAHVTPPTETGGTITGTINALSLARSRAALVTVGIDGTDRSVQVAPGATFTLTNVPPGLQTLVAYTADRAFAIVVGVEKQAVVRVGDVALKDAGQISGIVRDADTGEALADARVTVTESVLTNTASQLPSPIRVLRTNAFGSYTLYGLPVGDYLVHIGKPGYDAVTLALTVSTGTTVGDAKLTKNAGGATGSVSGVVNTTTAAGEVQPLAGAMVRLVPPATIAAEAELPVPSTAVKVSADGQPTGGTISLRGRTLLPEREFFAFTGIDGAFQITGVPAGTYLAVAVRAGMNPARQTVAVTAGTDAALTFSLTPHQVQTGTVTGLVTGANNAPVAGAVVSALLEQPDIPFLSGTTVARDTMVSASAMVLATTTGADGRFRLVVPPAVCKLHVSAVGYSGVAVSVTVTTGGTTDAGTIALTPFVQETGTVKGKVVDAATGAGIADATVQAGIAEIYPMAARTSPVPPNLPPTAVTDAAGEFSLLVPTQTQGLLVFADGYNTQRIAVAVVKDGVVTITVKMSSYVPPTAIVSGQVTNRATGKPIAGAQVSPLFADVARTRGSIDGSSASPIALLTVTDDAGWYKLVVPVQATAIQAVAPGFARQAVPVSLTGGVPATANLQLTPISEPSPAMHTLFGTVFIETSAGQRVPAANATVGAMPPVTATAAFFTAQTDAQGHFKLIVPDGRYTIVAKRDGLASARQEVSVTADTSVVLVIAGQPLPL
jgi:hypothetical protein